VARLALEGRRWPYARQAEEVRVAKQGASDAKDVDLGAHLARLEARVPGLTPAEAWTRAQAGALLVDVRPAEERAEGSPPGALGLARDALELSIGQHAPASITEIMCICAGGTRSLLAADDLLRLGYSRVASVTGGLAAWRAAGLPLARGIGLDAEARARFDRQIRLPKVGETGQLKLLAAKVALVGAGGLGSPAALYLAAAGVGTLSVFDDDVVARSNLHRQVLHGELQVGVLKVESASQALRARDPRTVVFGHAVRIDSSNAEDLLRGHDLVVDGADNFATRFAVAAACARLGVPHVYGAVADFEGQVSVFDPANGGPCYACVFPQAPPADVAPSCAEAGVLGVLPGVVGLLQAVEALKLLLGLGTPLRGRLLHYDALGASTHGFKVERRPHCQTCGGSPAR
jgi:molybdopterin/thiamine biosynthesis adenylyltransferase/rhodanese-related sulfurtransferase